MIDTYSLLVVVMLFNLSIAAIALLRRLTGYLSIRSAHTLVLLAVLSVIYGVYPFRHHFAYTVYSYETIPAIETALYVNRWQEATIMDVILLIWGIGSLVMLFNTVRVLLKDRNFRKRYRIANNMRAVIIARELKLKRAEIVVSPDVVVPYVIGLLRARIFLPDIDMDENTLTLILKHEYQHFKSRDLFTKMFYLLLSIVFWWNPISHVFLREIDCLLEVRCDAAMTKRMSEGEKTQYMESLLYIARHIQATDTKAPVNILSFARMEQRGFIMQRFSFIQSSKSVKYRVKQIFPVVVVVMFFLVSFFIEVQPNYREYSRPYTPMRQLTDEELEQRGLLGDITSIDTGDGEILIIVQDAQRSFTDLSEAQGGALRPGTHSTPENSP